MLYRDGKLVLSKDNSSSNFSSYPSATTYTTPSYTPAYTAPIKPIAPVYSAPQTSYAPIVTNDLHPSTVSTSTGFLMPKAVENNANFTRITPPTMNKTPTLAPKQIYTPNNFNSQPVSQKPMFNFSNQNNQTVNSPLFKTTAPANTNMQSSNPLFKSTPTPISKPSAPVVNNSQNTEVKNKFAAL
jgi:hypothetical protein